MATTTSRTEFTPGEKGYSWFHFSGGRASLLRLIATFLSIGIAAGYYYWYTHFGNDAAPDSNAGLTYAVLGTICLLLAAVLYTCRRRFSKKRTVGKLYASLHLHMCFAMLGLALLFMHSFGNFNPRSGTYALYGMVALVISGFVGRILDRILPRLIASEVHKALNTEGEDRIETISQRIEALVIHNAESVGARSIVPASTHDVLDDTSTNLPHRPWDLAYISLEATPQELHNHASHHRFILDKKSALTEPGALLPGAQEQIAALQGVQKALQREQFYRYIIHYWRRFHILLALLTLGLMIWHLVYAAQLLLPVYFHF